LLIQACAPALARADDAVPQLSPVRVTGAADKLSDPGQTEGAPSYTANKATVSKTGANVRDIPNSVSIVTRSASSTVTMFWSSMRWRVTIETELG
ncbi:hypothetical protein FGX01_05485, partial [Xylella fastidiosa subsp. multiplex]|nr:hypothetical protein [Xylella fastidiosa subsp. multiplex]